MMYEQAGTKERNRLEPRQIHKGFTYRIYQHAFEGDNLFDLVSKIIYEVQHM